MATGILPPSTLLSQFTALVVVVLFLSLIVNWNLLVNRLKNKRTLLAIAHDVNRPGETAEALKSTAAFQAFPPRTSCGCCSPCMRGRLTTTKSR